MLGQYKVTPDAKGRVIFPSKFRDELGSTFVIAKNIDAACIKVYSDSDWKELVEKIKAMPQVKTAAIQRFLFGSASPVELDKQGRFVIPSALREYAEIDSEAEAVIVGLEGRAEIWSKSNWDKNNQEVSRELIDTAMELGI